MNPSLPSYMRFVQHGAVAIGYCWLFLSAFSLAGNMPDLFARAGSIGLASVVILFLGSRATLQNQLSELQVTMILAQWKMVESSFRGDDPDYRENHSKRMEAYLQSHKDFRSLVNLQALELLGVILVSLQWGFGDWFLCSIVDGGLSQCND